MEGSAMATLLSQATELFTWVMGNIATIAETITSNPILLIGWLITLVGLCVGIVRRLMNLQ